MKLSTHVFSSPIGKLFVALDEGGALVRLQFVAGTSRAELEEDLRRRGYGIRGSRLHCAFVVDRLREYFRGERWTFDLTLAARGTPFQEKVWKEVARIPYGETRSYAQIARRVRHPTAVRAVGRCNATNPIVIVVPCHRVVGSDGRLTGYGGGLEAKERLLELEGCRLEAG